MPDYGKLIWRRHHTSWHQLSQLQGGYLSQSKELLHAGALVDSYMNVCVYIYISVVNFLVH